MAVTGAVGGEALGDLLLEGKRAEACFRFQRGFVEWLYVKLCRAHCAQNLNPLP
jgi:hypothetical protein